MIAAARGDGDGGEGRQAAAGREGDEGGELWVVLVAFLEVY